MGKADDLVLLARAAGEIEATIWRDALEQEGIPVWIRNRDPLAPIGVPLHFDALEVYVLRRDEQRARWVIGERAEPGEDAAESLGGLPSEEQEPAARD